MHYMHIKFSCLAYTWSHKFNIYLQYQVIQQKISASRRRERGIELSLENYFLQVQTSLKLWPSSDVGTTTIAFLQAFSSAFFHASSLLQDSFFLLALIYRASAALSFLVCWSSFLTKANLFSNFWIWKWTYIFSNYTIQLKSRSNLDVLTSLTREHSSL
jgi:hypothetical protein